MFTEKAMFTFRSRALVASVAVALASFSGSLASAELQEHVGDRKSVV